MILKANYYSSTIFPDNSLHIHFPYCVFFGHLMFLQFLQTLKVPTKIDHHFHYLDIQAIESKKPNQVVFK